MPLSASSRRDEWQALEQIEGEAAMPRNLINRVAYDPEPMLAEVSQPDVHRTWLPAFALEMHSLDVARWQTRAARGLSWHRSGQANTSSRSH